MADNVKKSLCTICAHRNVCAYKDDYLSVIEAVSKAIVDKQLPDGKIALKRVENFEFVGDISVTCRYYDNCTTQYRNTID